MTTSPKTATLPAPAVRAKTLTPADAKRLAKAAPSLLKTNAKTSYPATSPRALHYAHGGGAYCGTPASGPYAAAWARTTCRLCLALRVQERKAENNASAERYHERKRAEKAEGEAKTAQRAANNVAFAELAKESAELARAAKPVEPSVQDDTRHFREAANLDEAHVRPAQLVAAIEVMIASAHERRRRDEAAKRPVDRFVWGQLEALRSVVELVRLAARKERA